MNAKNRGEICLLSGDRALSQLVDSEAKVLNVSCRIELPENAYTLQDTTALLLLDLDSLPTEQLPPIPAKEVIGITREPQNVSDALARGLSALWKRPFLTEELRKVMQQAGSDRALPLHRRKAGGIPKSEHVALHLDSKENILLCAGERIALTPNESAILSCLLEHRGEAVSRDTLVSVLAQMDSEDSAGTKKPSNRVEVYVCLLRHKLEKPFRPRLLHTVRGIGYCLD